MVNIRTLNIISKRPFCEGPTSHGRQLFKSKLGSKSNNYIVISTKVLNIADITFLFGI